jgi:hypothetical protein
MPLPGGDFEVIQREGPGPMPTLKSMMMPVVDQFHLIILLSSPEEKILFLRLPQF